MEKTIFAMKMVVKAVFMLLYRSNSEAYWIDKNLAKWSDNFIWQGYWNYMARVAVIQKNAYLKMAEAIH